MKRRHQMLLLYSIIYRSMISCCSSSGIGVVEIETEITEASINRSFISVGIGEDNISSRIS